MNYYIKFREKLCSLICITDVSLLDKPKKKARKKPTHKQIHELVQQMPKTNTYVMGVSYEVHPPVKAISKELIKNDVKGDLQIVSNYNKWLKKKNIITDTFGRKIVYTKDIK